MKQAQRGFALLDVLLAVVLMAVAAYGTYQVAKGYRVAASVKTLEQRAITISQNYLPFLADTATSTSALYRNRLAESLLKSIGIPSSSFVTSDGWDNNGTIYWYVYTDTYYNKGGGPTMSIMNFGEKIDSTTTGGNYFAIGFNASGAQLNQIIQDLNSTFSIYYNQDSTGNLTASVDATTEGLVDADSYCKNNACAVFLLFPKMSGAPDLSMTTVT